MTRPSLFVGNRHQQYMVSELFKFKHMGKAQSFVLTALLLIVLMLLITAYLYIIDFTNSKLETDFQKLYQSQQLWQQDRSIYQPTYIKLLPTNSTTSEKSLSSVNLNSPLFNSLLIPLGYLPYTASVFVWEMISLLAGIVGILLVIKAVNLPLLPLNYALAWILILLLYHPVYVNLILGQVGLVLLPLFVIAWRYARNGKIIAAGLLLGILSALKPFFGLFIFYFFWRREHRGILAFVAAFITSIMVGLLCYGFQSYVEYYHVFSFVDWYAANWNASLFGFLQRIIAPPRLASIIYCIFSILLIIGLRYFLTYPLPIVSTLPKQQLKADLDFSMISIVMLLLSPLGWIYYFCFLVISFATLWRALPYTRHSVAISWITIGALFLTNLPSDLTFSIIKETPLNILLCAWSYSFYALLLLLTAVCLTQQSLLSQPKMLTPAIPTGIRNTLIIVLLLPTLLLICNTFFTLHHDKPIAPYTIIPDKNLPLGSPCNKVQSC